MTEHRLIWTEMQDLLEDSAYVGNKIPISQQNEDDRNAFTVLRKKFERSKKFRTLNKVKPEKPRYDDTTGIPIYRTESGLGPDLEDLMYLLLDNQNYGQEFLETDYLRCWIQFFGHT